MECIAEDVRLGRVPGQKCRTCNGFGQVPATNHFGLDRCPDCGGTGKVLSTAPTPRAQNGLAAILGKWPGDETDEEIEVAMNGLRGGPGVPDFEGSSEVATQCCPCLRCREAEACIQVLHRGIERMEETAVGAIVERNQLREQLAQRDAPFEDVSPAWTIGDGHLLRLGCRYWVGGQNSPHRAEPTVADLLLALNQLDNRATEQCQRARAALRKEGE
jgi:hypothetical protein